MTTMVMMMMMTMMVMSFCGQQWHRVWRNVWSFVHELWHSSRLSFTWSTRWPLTFKALSFCDDDNDDDDDDDDSGGGGNATGQVHSRLDGDIMRRLCVACHYRRRRHARWRNRRPRDFNGNDVKTEYYVIRNDVILTERQRRVDRLSVGCRWYGVVENDGDSDGGQDGAGHVWFVVSAVSRGHRRSHLRVGQFSPVLLLVHFTVAATVIRTG